MSMAPAQALRARMVCQGLMGAPSPGGSEGATRCVRRLVATPVAHADHALGLRSHATPSDLRIAVAQGLLFQTHVLRPSRQLVSASDMRWIQELTSSHVEEGLTPQLNRLGLDAAVIGTSMYAIAYLLADSNQMTAAQMAPHLAAHGLPSGGPAYQALLGIAALRGLTCFRDGAYLLVDDVLPLQRHLDHDEAAARLARRFFAGHGPSSLGDFARWSNLPISVARRGQEAAAADLIMVEIDGLPHFGPRTLVPVTEDAVILVALNDEVIRPYRDVPFPSRAPLPDDSDGVILLGIEIVGTFRFGHEGIQTTLIDVTTTERHRIEHQLSAT